jgi:hypothetical protein
MQVILNRVACSWCRAGKLVAIVVLVTFLVIAGALRATLHFAALPFELPTRRERSELSRLTRRTTGLAVDAMYVMVPLIVLVWQWS